MMLGHLYPLLLVLIFAAAQPVLLPAFVCKTICGNGQGCLLEEVGGREVCFFRVTT